MTNYPDIIVSIANGYKNINQYNQFITTLRKTGAKCPIFLGISDGPDYSHIKKYLLDNAVNYFIVPPINPPNKVVKGYRFEQYKNWLRDMKFRYALLMDFRDAYFQRDPFENVDKYMNGCDLYLMSEFIFLTIKNHPNGVNYQWVARPFGIEVAESIKDKVILNSGAIMGNKKAIMITLEALANTTKQQNFEFEDQGTLNYLAHTGLLSDCGVIKIERAGVSLVNNCGFTELELLRNNRVLTLEEEQQIEFIPKTNIGKLDPYQDSNGYVLDDDGNISYAVHQYDRFPHKVYNLLNNLLKYEHPDNVYVADSDVGYKSEKYTISTKNGIKQYVINYLVKIIKNIPINKKPLIIIDDKFKRNFVFTYGIIHNELLCESDEYRMNFFKSSDNSEKCENFCKKWGYTPLYIDERQIFN